MLSDLIIIMVVEGGLVDGAAHPRWDVNRYGGWEAEPRTSAVVTAARATALNAIIHQAAVYTVYKHHTQRWMPSSTRLLSIQCTSITQLVRRNTVQHCKHGQLQHKLIWTLHLSSRVFNSGCLGINTAKNLNLYAQISRCGHHEHQV